MKYIIDSSMQFIIEIAFEYEFLPCRIENVYPFIYYVPTK
jgi:hypothetical protein